MTKKTEKEETILTFEEGRPYALKPLAAQHLFLLARVIAALDVKRLAGIITSKVDVSESDDREELAKKVGYETILEIVGVALENLPACQNDLFKFLSAVSNLSEREVGELPPADFVDMIHDVIVMPSFGDFFKRCGTFLSSGNLSS